MGLIDIRGKKEERNATHNKFLLTHIKNGLKYKPTHHVRINRNQNGLMERTHEIYKWTLMSHLIINKSFIEFEMNCKR